MGWYSSLPGAPCRLDPFLFGGLSLLLEFPGSSSPQRSGVTSFFVCFCCWTYSLPLDRCDELAAATAHFNRKVQSLDRLLDVFVARSHRDTVPSSLTDYLFVGLQSLSVFFLRTRTLCLMNSSGAGLHCLCCQYGSV